MGMQSLTKIILLIILTWSFGAHASECPKYTGVYNERSGVVKSMMAFNITKDGQLYLVTRDTGIDGAMLNIDGQLHSVELSSGKIFEYVATCDRGYLIVEGLLNGKEFVMTISDESGGRIVTSDSRGQSVYGRTLRTVMR